MSKHTKGPWLFKRDEYGDRAIKADGKSIMCDTSYYPWCPNADADWHLIALSPEMLDALKDAHPHIADDALRARIGNLIAKAEGEQQ